MSVESFIHAMPKVELHVQLEGALQRDTLMLIAEQNDIPGSLKRYRDWVALYDEPDYRRTYEIMRTTSSWLHVAEDLTRAVYDLGLWLSKQNVRYAEVMIEPAIYTDNGMSFEAFMAAINDGRDRVQRAWHVTMNWVLTIPRNRPRKSDDIARWAVSATARKGFVVGLGLSGQEDEQPTGQFKRAFAVAKKHDLPRIVQAGNVKGTEGVHEALTELEPTFLLDSYGIVDDAGQMKLLAELGIPLGVSLLRELRLGRIAEFADYPIQQLYDADVPVIIGSGLPMLYKSSLNDEYQAVVAAGLGVDELEQVALNAIRCSHLPDDQKQAMIQDFTASYAQLREEHLSGEETEA